MSKAPRADRQDGDQAYAEALSIIGSSAGVRLVATVIGAAAGIAATSLAVRLLGVSRYGVVAFLMSVVTLLPAMGRIGVMSGAIRAFSDAHSRADEHALEEITRGTLTITLLSGLVGAALVFTAAQFVPPGLETGTRVLLGLGLGILLLGSEFAVGAIIVSRSLGRVVLTEAPTLTLVVGRLIVLLALWAAGAASLRTVAVAYGVTGIAAAIVSRVILSRLLPRARRIWRPDLPAARALIALTTPYLVLGLAAIAMERFDVFVLGLTRSSAEVGQYEPTLKLVERTMSVMPLLFAAQYLPAATRLLASNAIQSFRNLYGRISKIAYVLAFPAVIALGAFPETLLRTLYGGAFEVSPGVMWALLTGYGVNLALGFNVSALAATGNRTAVFRVGAITLVAMVGLAILLIPPFGAPGAAWATSASYMAMNLACAWTLWRATGVHPFRADLVAVVATSILPLGVGLVVRTTLAPDSIWEVAAWTFAIWAAWIAILFASRLVRGSEITPLLAATRRDRPVDGLHPEGPWD